MKEYSIVDLEINSQDDLSDVEGENKVKNTLLIDEKGNRYLKIPLSEDEAQKYVMNDDIKRYAIAGILKSIFYFRGFDNKEITKKLKTKESCSSTILVDEFLIIKNFNAEAVEKFLADPFWTEELKDGIVTNSYAQSFCSEKEFYDSLEYQCQCLIDEEDNPDEDDYYEEAIQNLYHQLKDEVDSTGTCTINDYEFHIDEINDEESEMEE